MTIRPRFLALSIAVCAAAPCLAADPAPVALKPAGKTSTLVVYGDDPCPKGAGDEIVVCARQPENERYRLPKRFRGKPATVADGSWTNKVADLDNVSRQTLPDSCSPVGSNGQSGCYHQFLAQARAQRRADQAEADSIP